MLNSVCPLVYSCLQNIGDNIAYSLDTRMHDAACGCIMQHVWVGKYIYLGKEKGPKYHAHPYSHTASPRDFVFETQFYVWDKSICFCVEYYPHSFLFNSFSLSVHSMKNFNHGFPLIIIPRPYYHHWHDIMSIHR